MKAFETSLFALMLLAVPLLAWIAGRAMARRDWRIGWVIAVGVMVTLIPALVRLVALAALEGGAFGTAMIGQMRRTADAPEVAFFFLALGVFMTMVGWTSTPAIRRAE